MRTSIINHPADEPLIIIRQWQLVFCEGNEVAAALLSFFEYWHNIKIDMASQNAKANEVSVQHGDTPIADTSLYQWHTETELISGIHRIAKTGKTLTKGIDVLIGKGVITVHKNPNPVYKFDKKRYFLFYPKTINTWLKDGYPLIPKEITSSSSKITSSSSKITPAITETSYTKTSKSKKLSANADYSLPVSLLSEKEVKALELGISVWREYLTDEQAERGRNGVIKFIEGKIRYWGLLPHNSFEIAFFGVLREEYEADGRDAPKKFPCLETKRLFNEAAQFHNGTLDSVIKKAIHKRGKGIKNIVDYINSPEWQKGQSNGQGPTQSNQRKTNGKTSQGPSRDTNFSPPAGSGQTSEMAARLRAAFTPKD